MAKRLFLVNVTAHFDQDVYVWADSEREAEEIATEEVDSSEVDLEGSAMDVDHRNAPAEDDEILGDPPDDDERILRRLERAAARHAAGPPADRIVEVPSLFEGCNPTPLPCRECGEEHPDHEDDCSMFVEDPR